MASLIQITPVFFVQDLAVAVRFLQHGLGFRPFVRYDDYAYLQRDEAGVRLLKANGDPGRVHAYIDVADVDALWTEFRARLTDELRNNPDGPRDQSYGQREFTVFGPEGMTLFFGQEIFRDKAAWQRAANDSEPKRT